MHRKRRIIEQINYLILPPIAPAMIVPRAEINLTLLPCSSRAPFIWPKIESYDGGGALSTTCRNIKLQNILLYLTINIFNGTLII